MAVTKKPRRTNSPKASAISGRHAAEHRHDGGIPRKLHRRFPEQPGKIEAVGRLQTGQRFENAQKIIRALSRRHRDRAHPGVFGDGCGLLPGQRAVQEFPLPAFLADAVGGVAAIGTRPICWPWRNTALASAATVTMASSAEFGPVTPP